MRLRTLSARTLAALRRFLAFWTRPARSAPQLTHRQLVARLDRARRAHHGQREAMDALRMSTHEALRRAVSAGQIARRS
jgi:hypothetical protein